MPLRDRGDGPQLIRAHDAVWQSNAHHEVLSGKTLAAFAPNCADTIALRVNPPPLEVHVGPLRRDGATSFTRELANLFDVLPRIERLLETLDLLGLGLFRRNLCRFCHRFLQ